MNDDQLGHDLRAALAEQTPPPSDGLQDVLRRGTRRRLGQHLATGAVALAAVAGIGTAATMFGTTATTPMTPAAQPGMVDWAEAGVSLTPAPGADRCDGHVEPKHKVGPGVLDLAERARDAIAGVAPDLTVGAPVTMRPYVFLDLAGPTGPPGSVTVHVGTYEGDPLTAADERAHMAGNCDPPTRRVLDDGTVLQIYPVVTKGEPLQSVTMVLAIFRQGGTFDWISVVNYASSDFEPREHADPERVGPGRESLQLTEAQLAEIGLELVNG